MKSFSVFQCSNIHEFFQLSGRSTTRGRRFKFTKQQCRGYRSHFFTTRVVNIWNFLPKDVVSFSTLCSFYSATHCKRCTICTAIPSVCPSDRLSVRPSDTRRYCVKTTASSTMQFALSDRKMCLVL